MKRETKKGAIVLALGIIAFLAVIGCNAYLAWNAATTKISAYAECEIDHIDYVRLDEQDGNGSCAFLAVRGDVSYCALPRDIHCKGEVADVPLMKLLLQAR